MIILGLLLEVMDLSGADLDNVTRPRLPSNAAKPAGGARRPGKRPIPARSAPWRAARVMAKSPTSRKGTSHHTGSARTPYAASPSRSSGKKARVEAVHAQSTSAKEATALEGLKARLGAMKTETGTEIAELAGKDNRPQSEVTTKLAKASERFDRRDH